MGNFDFKKWNTYLGWFAFAIALLVYSITVEPTVSFWDCGEYIATSAKLQVGHPPGAPLYQMIGAFFATFATSDGNIALMVNMVSVFSSAFTILFMYWSTTILLQKVINTTSTSNSVVILGAAFIASLSFTFTDSFWFNAVEAEVYAMASLFIALLFWLGLRWEAEMHQPQGNRWLLLISLVVGLSFGVHFMALLTIPSIGFLYYFKNYQKITIKNFIIANLVVVAVLLFIFQLLLPLTLAFFGKTEIFMVNSLGLPFNSGTIFVGLLFIAVFYFGLKYTKEKNLPQFNTMLLCILFILIGFSTWMMLPIRANANVPINENKPSDAAEVLAYYNREQYGNNPIFYGPQFSDMFGGLDPDNPYSDGKPNYERDYKNGRYVITNNYKNSEQNGDPIHKAFLPRMWSTDHAANYMNFTQVLDFRIDPEYAHEEELVSIVADFRRAYASQQLDNEDYISFLKGYGEYLIVDKPTMLANFSYMIEYQFGYMYWRYLMWNFTGRQNDVQGKYDNLDGNWLSGINFIDEMRLGSQDNLPEDMANNKARNTYYFLPFILAVLGIFFHYKRDQKSFYVLLVLFLFTGLVLKIYLNERPFEPRERDYALVGSFYIFAIWIAFGVFAVYEFLKKYMQPKIAIPVVLGVSLLASPILLASENWDDHDRSNRYTALAMAKNYLNSCDQNAILYTIGDNDTFPLWYAQEIEGIRPDIKIINTGLFMTDWYIDQMKLKTYEAAPAPISFTHDQYVGDHLNYSAFIEKTDARWLIKDWISFIASDDPQTKIEMGNGHKIDFYPTNKIRIPVDKAAVIRHKIVSPQQYDSIVPYIDVDIKGSAVYKNRLMMLDIVANNNWERPIYFTGGSFGDDDYLWMKDYLQLEGMVFKLVPIRTPLSKAPSPLDMGYINSDKMYANVMKWDWGNSGSPDLYHDPETRKNSITYRTNIARLMEQMINEGKIAEAKKLIELAMTNMPIDDFGYYTMVEPFAGGYYAVGETQKARKVLTHLIKKYQESLKYYSTLKASEQQNIAIVIVSDIERYRSLLQVMKDRGDEQFYQQNVDAFNKVNQRFGRFGRDAMD